MKYGPLEFRREDTDHAYAAGFFDGEGSVSILPHGDDQYRLRASVCNTDPEIIKWFSMVYGGVVKTRESEDVKWKTRYDLTLYANEAGRFLYQIFPFLKIKRQRAAIGILFAERRHFGPRTDDEKRKDRVDYEIMAALNARGQRPQNTQAGVKV
jgi:hypothetical protein